MIVVLWPVNLLLISASCYGSDAEAFVDNMSQCCCVAMCLAARFVIFGGMKQTGKSKGTTNISVRIKHAKQSLLCYEMLRFRFAQRRSLTCVLSPLPSQYHAAVFRRAKAKPYLCPVSSPLPIPRCCFPSRRGEALPVSCLLSLPGSMLLSTLRPPPRLVTEGAAARGVTGNHQGHPRPDTGTTYGDSDPAFRAQTLTAPPSKEIVLATQKPQHPPLVNKSKPAYLFLSAIHC